MNPAAILALISDLYQQITVLGEENKKLRETLEAKDEPEPDPVR